MTSQEVNNLEYGIFLYNNWFLPQSKSRGEKTAGKLQRHVINGTTYGSYYFDPYSKQANCKNIFLTQPR